MVTTITAIPRPKKKKTKRTRRRATKKPTLLKSRPNWRKSSRRRRSSSPNAIGVRSDTNASSFIPRANETCSMTTTRAAPMKKTKIVSIWIRARIATRTRVVPATTTRTSRIAWWKKARRCSKRALSSRPSVIWSVWAAAIIWWI